MYARNHITPDRALGGWQMNRSLRWEGTTGGSGSYLYRTGSSPTGGGKYSYSSWIKRTALSYQTCLWGAGGGSQTNSHAEGIYITSSDQIALIYRGALGGGSVGWYAYSKNLIRDCGSWYHIMLTYDNNQSGISNKIKYYFNGVEVPYYSGVGSPGDLEYVNKSGVTQYIGRMDQGAGPGYARVYQAETHVADGYIWTPSDFGYTDAHTGKWRPKRPEDISVDYGNNGFYLDYADNTSTSTIGIDRSGNSNNWTASGFSVSAGVNNDSMIDTPTNNFPIMSFINRGVDNPTVSDGGLYFGGSTDHVNVATIAIPSSGKWYWEYTKTANTNLMSGIIGDPEKTYNGTSTFLGGQANGYSVYAANGQTYAAGSNATYMATPSTSTTIMIAFDADTRRLYFGADGNWGDGSGNTNQTFANAAIAHTVTAGITYYPAGSFNGGSAYANFGQRAFSYTPPTGYRSLSSKNRATPVAAEVIRTEKHFDTLLYTGNNTDDTNITGLGFKPDFVWIKQRGGTNNHLLINSVQRRLTANTFLNSNNQNGDSTDPNLLQSFNKDGFQIGTSSELNENSQNYVAWCWKAGGSSNTFNVDGTGYATAAAAGLDDGTISLTGASVNTEAGFSIVAYDGTDSGSSQTIPHGLNKPPEFWMWKCRSSSTDWIVYTTAIDGGSDYLKLNENSAASSGVSPWDTLPTSSLITVGTNNADTCNAGDNYLLYSWHSVPGYSKISIYKGNGSSDGVYVDCGFKPAWLLIKRSDSGDTKAWRIVDNARNPNNDDSMKRIYPNETEAEYGSSGGTTVDWLSHGFKHRASTHDNVANATYLYMAFAEKPSGTAFGLDANAH